VGDVRARTVGGLSAAGVRPDDVPSEIRGSTTIVGILRMYPNGEAAKLMACLGLPCAHCGGAFNEPLTLAAQRHRRDARAVLEAFLALAHGGPSDSQIAAAVERRVLP
jgi:hypothetical protein